jgi:hypothetical protein
MNELRPCDVCVLTRQNVNPQEDVEYCKLCDAWICAACNDRLDSRMVAMLKRRWLSWMTGLHRSSSEPS